MKLLNRLAKTIIPLGILSFLIWRVIRDANSPAAISWRVDWWSVGLLVIALVLVHLTAVWGWQLIVSSVLRQRMSFRDAFVVWTLSNSVRYLPGSVWQYAMRIALSKRYHIEPPASLALLVVEAVHLVLSAGAFIVLWAFTSQVSVLHPTRWILLGAYPVAVAVAGSDLLPYLLRKMARFAKQDLPMPRLWTPRSIPTAACYLIHFALSGAVLTYLVAAFTPYTVPLPSAAGMFALAWLSGYVAVFAPGGLGVAEASLAGLLSIQMPFGAAAATALTLRMANTASDLLFGTVSYLMFRLQR